MGTAKVNVTGNFRNPKKYALQKEEGAVYACVFSRYLSE
jgi:hypothetical protein